ncbi:MAG: T9SS type A sorting domain-containing protein, partial [Candidatus Krumholzibacteria bacterium]|nr:T9SS type A sorting domain-containing protein [Candidatus Krumholzibacteria bacterium]
TYTVWRAITEVAAVSPEMTSIRVQQMGAETFYWELIDSQIAQHLDAYSKTVPTLFDSTAVSPDPHYFQVIAHTEDPLVYWISNVGMGRSLDNLSPSPPLMLSAQRDNGDVDLEWNTSVENVEDLLHYAVYRSESSGFPPELPYLLVTTTDTLMTDTTADPAKAYFYITTAVDVHDNESEPSNEANVDPVATAIGDKAPRITSLTVLPNSPNPFSTGTTWRVGVPSRSDVTIEVYDVAGRRVFTRRLPQARVGWREVYFDGRDSTGKLLPSGVYLYRVTAAGVTRTQKMVIAR